MSDTQPCPACVVDINPETPHVPHSLVYVQALVDATVLGLERLTGPLCAKHREDFDDSCRVLGSIVAGSASGLAPRPRA